MQLPMNTPKQPIHFTDSAAAKVYQLIQEDGNPELKLRVFITGGGCSGFQYGFSFEEVVNTDDTVISKEVVSDTQNIEEGGNGGGDKNGSNTVKLLVDAQSLQYLLGAEIDFRDDLTGSQFVIRNPKAKSTCGCGSSFSADL